MDRENETNFRAKFNISFREKLWRIFQESRGSGIRMWESILQRSKVIAGNIRVEGAMITMKS